MGGPTTRADELRTHQGPMALCSQNQKKSTYEGRPGAKGDQPVCGAPVHSRLAVRESARVMAFLSGGSEEGREERETEEEEGRSEPHSPSSHPRKTQRSASH